ncbi:MAG: serine/threonine protein kinase [Deltaproteobacteria bacterium]|nr:serine/threonine protein kinase [Deltaproteobacteria bacterium]
MPNRSSKPAAAQNAEGAGGQAPKQTGPDPLLGRLINDRFKVVSLVARGGMGKVYKAEQAPLGRVCAIKVLNPNYSGDHDPEFHKRFFLEASISSKLTHPNTVTIFDYGRTDDNIYYMAMEYLEGRTLHRTLREEGPFVEERATHIARQVCRSLREAHSLGVIHRDLKPANVYLIEHGDEKDFVKVLDFGLVKNIEEGKGEDLTQTGLFMGSPKYMAPEQIRGEHVDARTDIYALGVILYEMVTGKVPFDRPNSVNILMAHVNEPVPKLRDMNPSIAVSEALEATIYKCVEKNPDDRYKSMDEVLGALKRAGGGAMTGTISGADRSGGFDMLSTTGSFTPQPTPGLNALSPDSGSGAILANAGAAAEKRGSKTPLIIGGVVALLAVAGIIAMVSSKGSDSGAATNPSTTAAATAAPTPTPTPTPSPAPAPAPSPTAEEAVKLKVDTEPSGAQVREDGSIICDKTPCDVLVTDKPRKLSLELKDYKSESISVKKGDPDRQVKLTKVPTWTPPAGGGKKDQGGGAPGGGKDFKDSPY